jgi:hypothetical protein
LSEDERNAAMGDADSIMKELMDSGEWVSGEALADPSNSRTVRVREGIGSITDGPFAESKEQLAGFCIIDCETEARALDIAERWPDAKYCAMEVRPIMGSAGLEM